MTLSVDVDGHLVEVPKTLELNGVRYLMEPVRGENQVINGLSTTLATVIYVDDTDITVEWIRRCIDNYKETDDVFQTSFLHGILFSGPRDGCSLSLDAHTFLTGLGMQYHRILNNDQGNRLLPGLYVIMNGALYEPFRLYADTHAAFFAATSAPGDNYGHVDVAIPSRLRHHVSSKLPLTSIRVAVKDNFDLAGTKTSLCSRSYLETYPEKSQSAPCVQRLLDLGASIVGKTKLCAFAQWEEPTEAIEYTSPWSARADGFQSSGESSNGSGAAISAYNWLDITIGSDNYWDLIDPQQREMADQFADEIASTLHLPLRTFSLKDLWAKKPPEDAGHQSLDDYMLKATQDMWYDDYHAFDDFRDRYWAEHQQAPYITPPTRAAWDFCKSISRSERDDAARTVQIFRSWFRDHFFQGSQPLFVMPIENVVPRYRDDPSE
ncbi:MAG: hypothetical protein Q9221_007952 [Calogaya cf. arnoldii]